MDKQPKSEPKGGFIYIIPAPLVEDGNHIRALLFGLITSLANDKGYCYASNEYMAKKLGRKSTRIITENLTDLQKNGWIEMELEKNHKRKIWPLIPLAKKRQPPSEITPEGGSEITPDSNISLSKINKNSLQAEPAEQGAKELKDWQKIIEVFYLTINPTISWGNKTNQTACEFLIKSLGVDRAIARAKYACQIQMGQDKFAPVITTPYQLKEKMTQLERYYNQHKSAAGRGERMQAI